MNKTHHIKPMGDHENDGYIQLSFTLPVTLQRAQAAAIELCRKMNLQQIEVADMQVLHDNITYIQVFAKIAFSIELPDLIFERKNNSREEIIKATKKWNKRLTIVGACTGTDAHTVGLDAILNKKGYKGVKGLESYNCFEVINLGSQVKNVELIQKIKAHKADIVLISQIITHQNVHLHNLTEFIDMLEANNLRNKVLCLIGGPRITNQLAVELGFDAGFGLGTLPLDVANYIFYNRIKN